jgi:hypothetical protein
MKNMKDYLAKNVPDPGSNKISSWVRIQNQGGKKSPCFQLAEIFASKTMSHSAKSNFIIRYGDPLF